MDQPIISVLVPIYNVEDYLHQCLSSIAEQTLRNIEIICINDGSTDGSLAIIRSFAADDDRFVIVDKPNSGYGSSINRGLDIARGEWISIIEPDDFIDCHMFETLVSNAILENGGTADVVKSSYWRYYDYDPENTYLEKPFLGTCMSGYRCEFTATENPEVLDHHPSIWSAIYRRAFLEQKSIRMAEIPGAGWADNPWLYETLIQAESIVWVPVAFYYYRQTNPNASMNMKDYHLPFDRLKDIRNLLNRLNVRDDGILTTLCSRSINYTFGTILANPRFNEDDEELNRLIRDELSQLDSRLVLADDNGISKKKKDCYRDIVGLRIDDIAEHEKVDNPVFSIILPVEDNSYLLWETIASINSQNFDEYEVVCISNNSKHRNNEIIRDVAAKDSRYRLVHVDADDRSTLFNQGMKEAAGKYYVFMAPGTEFSDSSFLERMSQACEGAPDIVCPSYNLRRFRNSRMMKDDDIDLVEVGRRPELVAGNVQAAAYGKAFSAEFVRKQSLLFPEYNDTHGCAFNALAYSVSPRSGFARGVFIRMEKRNEELRVQESIDVFANCGVNDIESLRELASAHDSRVSSEVLAACAIRCMADILRDWPSYRASADDFQRLKEHLESGFGIIHLYESGRCQNADDFLYVRNALAKTYESFVESSLKFSFDELQKVTRNRDANRVKARNRYWQIKELKRENKVLKKQIDDNSGIGKRIKGALRTLKS